MSSLGFGYTTATKEYKRDYLILKLVEGEGISLREIQDDLDVSYATAKRLIASIKDSIYEAYNDNVRILYDRTKRKYYLIIYKSNFNINNLPIFK